MTVFWTAVSPSVTEEAGTRGGTHSGIDLKAKLDDPVISAFDGEVVYVGGDGASGRIWIGDRWLYPNGEGKTIDIRRADGLISRVGHLNGYNVRQGQTVRAGDVIGFAGTTGYSTGVHIHWELRWDRAWVGGAWVNPRLFDPQVFDPATPEEEDEEMAEEYRAVMYTEGGLGSKQTVIIGHRPSGYKFKYTTRAVKGRNPENERWSRFFNTGDFEVVSDPSMLAAWEGSLDNKRCSK